MSIGDGFRDAARIRRDDRKPRAHRLDEGEGVALITTREDEDVGSPQQCRNVSAVAEQCKLCVNPVAVHEFLEFFALRPFACHHETDPGMRLQNGGRDPGEKVETFLRCEPANGEDERRVRGPSERGEQFGPCRLSTCRGGGVVRAVVNEVE